jgi:acyl-CoA thioester hydrolase
MTLFTLFNWPVRVYYEDTDAAGIVYYANYLKFMERARTEWLRQKNIELDLLASQQQTVFVVQKIQVDYLYPARFNELLTVQSQLINLGKASIKMRQQIENQEKICCQATVSLACVDRLSLRPKRLPQILSGY